MGPAWGRYSKYKTLFLTYMSRYKERQDMRVFLEIILSLAAVSVFSIFALKPTLTTIAELIRQIETKKETLARMNQKIQDLSVAQSLYSRETAKIRLLETSIPKSPEPLSLIRQAEGAAAAHTATILSETVGETPITASVAQETQSELSFSFTLTSGYQTLLDLLKDLENMRRPVKFNQLSLATSASKSGKILILVFDGSAPYFPGD